MKKWTKNAFWDVRPFSIILFIIELTYWFWLGFIKLVTRFTSDITRFSDRYVKAFSKIQYVGYLRRVKTFYLLFFYLESNFQSIWEFDSSLKREENCFDCRYKLFWIQNLMNILFCNLCNKLHLLKFLRMMFLNSIYLHLRVDIFLFIFELILH